MLMDPQPGQQQTGIHNAVWQLQQEVIRPKIRFKPTLLEKSGVDGGANQVPISIIISCIKRFYESA